MSTESGETPRTRIALACSEGAIEGPLHLAGARPPAHLDAIVRYANLTTCRREHLLSHFGDSAALGAAPCGGCDVCNPGPGLDARLSPGRRALAALAAVFGATRS